MQYTNPSVKRSFLSPDEQYLDLVYHTNEFGETITTRNSTVKRSIAQTLNFTETPLISVRKTAWRNSLREWEWIMSGSNRLSDLHPAVHPWWEPWKDGEGCIRYNYSQQMRSAVGKQGRVDQIALLVDGLKNHPNSRRLVLTTWNASDMAQSDCALTNCHNTVTQAFVVGGNRLRLVTYQRSCDVICGLPANLIQMAAFQLWLCHQTGLVVDGLTWIGGDVHIYDAHQPIVEKMLAVYSTFPDRPQLVYTPTSDEFKADDFSLSSEYKPILTDKAVMVV